MPKNTICPCGETVVVPFSNGEFLIHEVECPKCSRKATSGNWKTGEVDGWMTRAAIDRVNDEFAYHQWTADNNEIYGRGNW